MFAPGDIICPNIYQKISVDFEKISFFFQFWNFRGQNGANMPKNCQKRSILRGFEFFKQKISQYIRGKKQFILRLFYAMVSSSVGLCKKRKMGRKY